MIRVYWQVCEVTRDGRLLTHHVRDWLDAELLEYIARCSGVFAWKERRA